MGEIQRLATQITLRCEAIKWWQRSRTETYRAAYAVAVWWWHGRPHNFESTTVEKEIVKALGLK